METKLVVFKVKQIRRIFIDDKWYYAVVGVVVALTVSDKPRDYWYRMKLRESQSSGFELSTFCRQLKLESTDGKKYQTEVANTEDIFRIIQSIPAPKAEPFKGWLAKVAMNGCRRSRTRNWPQSALVQFTRPRTFPMFSLAEPFDCGLMSVRRE